MKCVSVADSAYGFCGLHLRPAITERVNSLVVEATPWIVDILNTVEHW